MFQVSQVTDQQYHRGQVKQGQGVGNCHRRFSR